MRTIIILFFLTIVLLSCSNQEDQIRQRIEVTYDDLLLHFDFRKISNSNFSQDLAKNIVQFNELEHQYQQKELKKGNEEIVTLINGDIMTSNFKGATSYSINSISLQDTFASAILNFENNTTSYNYHWSDTVQLIYERNDWRINDVKYYNHTNDNPGMKHLLLFIIQSESSTQL